MNPLRIGLVGYGGFGRFLRRTWEAADGVRVVAVAAHDDLPGDLPASRDWADVVARDDVDLVAVATPPDTHAAIGVAAIEAGKHLLVEKPVALTLADADRLIAARDAAGRVAAVDFMLRFNPLVEALAGWAHAGVFGALTRVALENEAQAETLGPGHWFWDPARSGGILVEHAVHVLDVVNLCAGGPGAVVGGWARRRPDGRADRVFAAVAHAGGPLGTHYHAFTRPTAVERTTLRFTFEQAEVDLEGWIPLEGRARALGGAAREAALAALPGFAPAPPPAETPPGLVAGTFGLGVPKADAYAGALRALLADVRRAIADPAHAVRAPLEAGREALRQALEATALAEGSLAETAPEEDQSRQAGSSAHGSAASAERA